MTLGQQRSESDIPWLPEAGSDAGVPARRALQRAYDYIVCGAGTGGSMVARRLADNPAATVLLIEAGGSDAGSSIERPQVWLSNLGSDHDWKIKAEPSPFLNGRSPLLSTGRVLGGGSSINAMIWSHGHRADWDGYANAVRDDAWGYDAVLGILRRVEDWHGPSDPLRRGTGGPLFVQPAPEPGPLAHAMLAAAETSGVPVYADANGAMMEQEGGAALVNLRVRDDRRLTVFRDYVGPALDRPNLTVIQDALVTRILLENGGAAGVEIRIDGAMTTVAADQEVVLALGAFNTPKLLMQSGIGDETELRRHGIGVYHHLPGVGRNLQDHVLLRGCSWASPEPVPFTNNGAEAVMFWKSDSSLESPDLQSLLFAAPALSPEVQAKLGVPAPSGWSLLPALVRPKSTGRVLLSGPAPDAPVRVEWGALSVPEDVAALAAAIELSRTVGNAAPLRAFRRAEIAPGKRIGAAMEEFIRDSASSYWHPSCTARMGLDDFAVVDAQLRVHGVARLRIADASVFPFVPTGNTMAPTVVVAERAADLLLAAV